MFCSLSGTHHLILSAVKSQNHGKHVIGNALKHHPVQPLAQHRSVNTKPFPKVPGPHNAA